MKTPKRKRASSIAKAEPGVETSGAAVAEAADVSLAPSEIAPSEPAPQPALAAEVAMTAVAEIAPAATAAAEPVIVLAANCSVKDAASLKTSLCAVAKEPVAVTLDARALERIDTATMQLLCAFVRDRIGRNQRVTWQGESKALRDAAHLLGVRALLGFEDANGVAA